MKKIIFLILFYYSSFCFAGIDKGEDYYRENLYKVIPCSSIPFFIQDTNNMNTLYTPKPLDVCKPLYFYKHPSPIFIFFIVDYNTSSDLQWDYADYDTRNPPVLSGNVYYSAFYQSETTTDKNYDPCVAAFPPPPKDANGNCFSYSIIGLTIPTPCLPPDCDIFLNQFEYTSILAVQINSDPQLQKSQKTSIKSNELQSEENSKLGSIANSKSTDISLLEDIKHLFSSMGSKFSSHVSKQKCDTFGVCDDSNRPPEFDDSAPELKNDVIDLAGIQPLMSGSGSCPADMSISVLGQNQTISFQTFCELAERARPVVIAAAQVAAAWLVFGAL